MDVRSLRRRCLRLLNDAELPVTTDVEQLRQAVSRRRGRPLHLIAKLTSAGPCGVWLALPTADYVFFEPDTSPLHREHIVHELGHLLAEHQPREELIGDVVRRLMPGLDPVVALRVMGRTVYSCEEEQEAEMIASLILERTGA